MDFQDQFGCWALASLSQLEVQLRATAIRCLQLLH